MTIHDRTSALSSGGWCVEQGDRPTGGRARAERLLPLTAPPTPCPDGAPVHDKHNEYVSPFALP